jgi:PAS domain S-box-containing protein
MKVLVIEDNPADVEMIRDILSDHQESSLELEHEKTLAAGIAHLARDGIGCILLDLGLPDSQGMGTVRAVHASQPEVPIVVLTGLDDAEMGVQALKEGAQDYLVKNQMNGLSLIRSIQYAHERNRIEEELIHKNQKLAESEEKFRTIVETANEGIWVVDADRRTTYVNIRMAKMLGYSPAEMVGRSYLDFVDEEGRLQSDRNVEQRKQGKSESYEFKLIRKDGLPLWTRVNAQPLFGKDGMFLGILSMLSDITDHKQGEEQLKEYAANLKRSNEDLERFAYIASHDLQEPLRNVISFSQLLSRRYKRKLDPDADEFIEYIVEGGKRMQTLVSDLLEYSRVNTRAEPFRSVDCEQVVDKVLQNLFFTIQENNAVIESTPLPQVNADPVQLGLVFQNLIANAIKFRRNEPPYIHISAEKIDQSWMFGVRDNGIGIDPAFHDRIFEIFQRLHTRDKYPGTGVGLAIVKKIIERHGGRIWVESEVGKGSTFYFTLPVSPKRDGGER